MEEDRRTGTSLLEILALDDYLAFVMWKMGQGTTCLRILIQIVKLLNGFVQKAYRDANNKILNWFGIFEKFLFFFGEVFDWMAVGSFMSDFLGFR